MSKALQLSIKRQREVISYDLLMYAQSRVYSLTISEKEIEFLILHKMFGLIEQMIRHNTLLAMDTRDMNVDQLFQANLIMQRQATKKKTMQENDDKNDIRAYEGGSKISTDTKNLTKRLNGDEEIDQLIYSLEDSNKNKKENGSKRSEYTSNSRKKKSAQGTRFVEKYLQISDILDHILDNTDIFIEDELQNANSRSEERKVLH